MASKSVAEIEAELDARKAEIELEDEKAVQAEAVHNKAKELVKAGIRSPEDLLAAIAELNTVRRAHRPTTSPRAARRRFRELRRERQIVEGPDAVPEGGAVVTAAPVAASATTNDAAKGGK